MTQVTTQASDYADAPVGIVHIGLGAFHRAHQAVFVERNLARHDGGEWGISSANIRSNQRLVELLRDRGQRYHVAEYADSQTLTLREIAAIREALYAGENGEDHEALLARLSDPAVRIVTLTVTEKGYYLSPAEGTLMVDAPAIAHDIAQPHAPRTAPGLLVEALARRRAAGIAPFTVLCCDNMPDNGKRTRRAVVELAGERDPALAEWIATLDTPDDDPAAARLRAAAQAADQAMLMRQQNAHLQAALRTRGLATHGGKKALAAWLRGDAAEEELEAHQASLKSESDLVGKKSVFFMLEMLFVAITIYLDLLGER